MPTIKSIRPTNGKVGRLYAFANHPGKLSVSKHYRTVIAAAPLALSLVLLRVGQARAAIGSPASHMRLAQQAWNCTTDFPDAARCSGTIPCRQLRDILTHSLLSLPASVAAAD